MTTRNAAPDPEAAVKRARGAYLAALHGLAPRPAALAELAAELAVAEREHAEAMNGGNG